jgi:peptidoglycan hydrolase CwlO-like protein
MKKLSQILISIFLSLACIAFLVSPLRFKIFSGEVEDLEDEVQQKEEELKENQTLLEQIEQRIEEISNSKYSLSEKISLLEDEISEIEEDIDAKDKEIEEKLKEIEEKEELLEVKKALLEEVSGELYVKSRYGFYNFLFSGKGLDDLIEDLYVRKSAISMLTDEIESISGEFSNLAEAKSNLEDEKKNLDEERDSLDESYDLLASERNKLQAELNSQYTQKSKLNANIDDLTKKVSQLQQAIIAARSAGLISTGGTTGTEEGTAISQAPAGYWGVFSIGAYTHRNGMSQWGAKARADAGQSYNTILQAYYPGTTLSTGTMGEITVLYCDTSSDDFHCPRSGYPVEDGCVNPSYVTYDFETEYLYRLGEMPEYFHIEALKAQAIAARTYALRVTNYGKTAIRADTCHQVVAGVKTGSWKTAVDSTTGKVLKSGSSLAVTQYAAVHGGWGNDVGWDTQSGTGDNWFNDAWEKISGVNWFYKSWYRYGDKTTGTNCGHSPWLSPTEMAAMINSYLIKNVPSALKTTADLSRLLPSDYGLCSGREDYGRTDKDPYTPSELKSLLKNPVNTVYSVNVSLSGGETKSVLFSTDAGNISISGMNFKDIYNQTAPGHMRIQQQSDYAYFNIERK